MDDGEEHELLNSPSEGRLASPFVLRCRRYTRHVRVSTGRQKTRLASLTDGAFAWR